MAKATITVTPKSAFGVLRYYPACARARTLAIIAGTSTLTIEDITLAKALGFKVVTSETGGKEL